MKQTSNILKVAVAVFLLLAMMLGLTACGGTPTYNNASGVMGSLSWTYDGKTKTLNITGAGEIADSASSTEVPWHSVRGGVETLKMADTVTAIGNYAFYGMSALKTVELSPTLTRIGDYAFAFSKMAELTLPESLTAIGNSAFEGCAALTHVVLPLSVKTIGNRCFAFCSALTDAVLVSPALESIPEEAFYKCVSLKNLVLHPVLADIPVAETAFAGAAATPESATFREDQVPTYTLTIRYLYEDGSEAKASFTDTMVDGASYSHLTPGIEGYTPDRDAVNGTIAGQDVVETVTYKKIVADTTEPPVTTEPTVEQKPDEGFTFGTVIAIVVLVVVIVGIIVGGVILVRMDTKNSPRRNTQKNDKNKKKK